MVETMNQFVLRVQLSEAPASPRDGALEDVPVIDGRNLIWLIGDFELGRGFDVPGQYGGIVIGMELDADALRDYFLGWSQIGERIAVLGCNCGAVGCWPLLSRVEADPRGSHGRSSDSRSAPSRTMGDLGQ
jgi:hypothetical protein